MCVEYIVSAFEIARSIYTQHHFGIKKMKKNELLEYYKKNDLNAIISIIELKKTEKNGLPNDFKKLIRETDLNGKTAIDFAIEQNNATLLFLLVEGGFYDHPFTNEYLNLFREHKNSSRNILRKFIMNKPDPNKVGLISAVFLANPLLSSKFIRELVQHCFQYINNPLIGYFYDAVLNIITALPDKDAELASIIFDIHTTRLDVNGLEEHLNKNIIFKNHDKYHVDFLLDIMDQLAHDVSCENKVEKFAIVHSILGSLNDIESSKSDLFLYDKKGRSDYSEVYEKITAHCFDHISKDDDQSFSELLAIAFEKNPDLINKIMMPLSFTFQKQMPAKRNRIYYCDSFFAVAAIRKNTALYTLLKTFININSIIYMF